MGKTILLCDLLRLTRITTEISIYDEHYNLLYVGPTYSVDISKYAFKIVLMLDIGDDNKLYVRIINENC